jgi:hypothetical protein
MAFGRKAVVWEGLHSAGDGLAMAMLWRWRCFSDGDGDGGVGGGAGGCCDRYILDDYVICYSYTGETDPSP